MSSVAKSGSAATKAAVVLAVVAGVVALVLLALNRKRLWASDAECFYSPRGPQSAPRPEPGRVPRQIFQTSASAEIPRGMAQAMQTWRDMNPGWAYTHFTGDECRAFLDREFPPRVVAAYDSLVPGSYKADLWRYCVLYHYGGVYADSAMVCVRPLDRVLEPGDGFVSAVDGGQTGSVYNAFMGCPARCPVVGRALALALDRIERQDYGGSCLYITGPRCLGDAVNDLAGRPRGTDFAEGALASAAKTRLLSRETPWTDRVLQWMGREHVGVISDRGQDVILTKYRGHEDENKCWRQTGHYGDLYEARAVFRTPPERRAVPDG